MTHPHRTRVQPAGATLDGQAGHYPTPAVIYGDELGCGPLNTQYTAHAGFVGVVLHVNIRKVMFGVRDVKTPPH